MRDSDIQTIIEQLDDHSQDVAEAAKAELIAVGVAALPLIENALGKGWLLPFGKLSVIEALEAWRDPAAGPLLAMLLQDRVDTVREWAAEALAMMPYPPAGDALVALHRRLVREGVPVDWSEPVAVRRALTALDLRKPVVPERVKSLANAEEPLTWPLESLAIVFTELAAHEQVILYWQAFVWAEGAPHSFRYGVEIPDGPRWVFDARKPWHENVANAAAAASARAAAMRDRSDIDASIEWIDREDVFGKLGLGE